MDIYSAMLYGSREPITSCVIIGTLSFVLGLLAGFAGIVLPPTKGFPTRTIKWLTSTVAEVFVAIPLLLILIGLIIDHNWRYWTIAALAALVIFLWGAVFAAQQVRRRWVVADQAGESPVRTARVLLPTIVSRALSLTKVSVVIGFLVLVVLEFFWGYIGAPYTSWGTLLESAYERNAIFAGAWWWYVPPVLGVCALLVSVFVILDTLERIIRKRENVEGTAAASLPQPTTA